MNTINEYIEQRIKFLESFHDYSGFYTALQDHLWAKNMINSNDVDWDKIASVLSPYLYESHKICIANYSSEFLPLNVRLEAKEISDKLRNIFEEIVSKCQSPFDSALIFIQQNWTKEGFSGKSIVIK